MVGGIADVVTAAVGRPWFYFDEDIQDKRLMGAELPKPIARNDGRAGIPRTFWWPIGHPPRRGLAMRVANPLYALWRDPDPSRLDFGHGIGDFARRA
jgi:hypothetical protein